MAVGAPSSTMFAPGHAPDHDTGAGMAGPGPREAGTMGSSASDPADGPIRCLSATTLVTGDMAASVAFYEALGFNRRYGGADAAFTSYHVGDGFLNLQAGVRRTDEVWGRVIIWVDDVDGMYRRARSAGYVPETEPADATWGERYFHIRDPSGHELSFARPL